MVDSFVGTGFRFFFLIFFVFIGVGDPGEMQQRGEVTHALPQSISKGTMALKLAEVAEAAQTRVAQAVISAQAPSKVMQLVTMRSNMTDAEFADTMSKTLPCTAKGSG
ncbi:hypothetical protein AK812_SmicGene35820 [Symbiodinium microadriaticum]|uniref:Uncharacterized protein n=1 Tax=Symbiodinium microadriaticum TaxID=2951 RepID=A0A1Q9CKG7_SYMMI|nr:hypothetical protein AK812_SmicGene35820 [Symbiodinium microadriaticum]